MYIKKEITTTAQDYKYLVQFTEFYRKKSNFLLMMGGTVLAVASLILGALNIIPLWLGIALAVVFLMTIPFVLLKIRKKIKDGIKYGKVVLNTTRTLELTGAGIKIYGGRTDTNVEAGWNTIFAVYELENCFLLYITHDTAFCINKSQLLLTESYELRSEFIKRLKHRFFKRCK